MSASSLRLAVVPLRGDGDSVEVLAGMVEGRQWERLNGKSVAKAIEETPTVIVELAHLAYRRRHDSDVSLEDFEAKFDVEIVAPEGEVPADPSVPATAPLSD